MSSPFPKLSSLCDKMSDDYLYSTKKGLLQSEALHQYILETNVLPREHELLKKLREATKVQIPRWAQMSVPPEEGQLLSIIMKAMNAKRTIEVGVFTGYSLLATALALPKDAKITAIDISREYYEVGLPFIKEAGVEDKINFIESDAVAALNKLVDEIKEDELFDFAFIDAEKSDYWHYHESLLKLVRVGGLICYDNTLWLGTVAHPPQKDVPEFINSMREDMLKFNKKLAVETRVELSQIKEDELFDFAFIEAEKSDYWHYHESLLKLVRVGGLICYDNTLWFGTVAHPPREYVPEFINPTREIVLKFNKKLAANKRVELSQVCIGDGLPISRRLV